MLVTIGIPTYDRFLFLKEAVGSALAQSHQELEVLVSDDGYAQEIAAWGLELAQRDRRVRYEKTSGKVGLAANWNRIARGAKGEYTLIIGDDDRLLSTFVERLLSVGAGADAIFCNHYFIDAHGRRLEAESWAATAEYGRSELQLGSVPDAERFVWMNAVPMSASLIRTTRLREHPFKEDLNTPELEFFAALATRKSRLVFVPEYLAEYRVHDSSATSTGLSLGLLAAYLAAIPVSKGAIALKNQRISMLMRGAATLSLRRGRISEARRLVRSPLYPSWRTLNLRVMGQVVCAHLPASWATKVHYWLSRDQRDRGGAARIR